MRWPWSKAKRKNMTPEEIAEVIRQANEAADEKAHNEAEKLVQRIINKLASEDFKVRDDQIVIEIGYWVHGPTDEYASQILRESGYEASVSGTKCFIR